MKPRGGKRKGAGRKPAPYKTVTVAFRVKEHQAAAVKELVKNFIRTSP